MVSFLWVTPSLQGEAVRHPGPVQGSVHSPRQFLLYESPTSTLTSSILTAGTQTFPKQKSCSTR